MLGLGLCLGLWLDVVECHDAELEVGLGLVAE